MTDDFDDGLSSSSTIDGGDTSATGYIEQAGVLCLRRKKGKAEVLLIRGRRTGKWGIPKGGIEVGETSSQAAAREAFEEAGVAGRCEKTVLATFRYQKQGKTVPCRVSVHRMDIERTTKAFPEAAERSQRWFDCESAADLVGEDGLRQLLKSLA